jgi:oligopeptidase A
MLRQLHFARLDLELHSKFDPDGPTTIFDCDRRLAKDVFPMMPLPEDRFLCSFAHIFAGSLAMLLS